MSTERPVLLNIPSKIGFNNFFQSGRFHLEESNSDFYLFLPDLCPDRLATSRL